MYKLLFLAPLFMILSACSEKAEVFEFKPPVIDNFEILNNGEVKLTGAGFNALKDVDETFNFSVSMHKSIGESSFIAFGEKPEIKDDNTMILKASQINKAQLYVRNEKTISDSMKALITPEWNGEPMTVDIPKEKYLAVIGQLASGATNCTLWLDLKDVTKVFWKPEDKDRTFTLFGHYELYNYEKGNQSKYNGTKLNYITRDPKQN